MENTKEWKHDLFGCFDDIGTCLLACCCPCWVYGQNKAIFEKNDSAFMNCMIFFCCSCVGTCLAGTLRNNIRQTLGIKPHAIPGCGNCLTHACCCSPCAMTQEYLELKDYQKTVQPQGAPEMMVVNQ